MMGMMGGGMMGGGAVMRQRFLTLVHGEMETIKLMPNSYAVRLNQFPNSQVTLLTVYSGSRRNGKRMGPATPRCQFPSQGPCRVRFLTSLCAYPEISAVPCH